MKKILVVLVGLMIGLSISSCSKDDDEIIKTYELEFEAKHSVSEENQFASPGAYYSWSVDDENHNPKYEVDGEIVRQRVTGTTTAQTGDWIFIYLSVDDVFCSGWVSCESSDGAIYMFESTDNLYINSSDGVTARTIVVDGKEIKEVCFQIK